MVKSELAYNPYLLETIVAFNGEQPRINSQIEKYQNARLQDWIEKLPYVFHDEMNGYGFEFHFSGVKADFERIKTAFANAGVTEDQVTFFYKNELEDPIKKNKRINELVKWLEENRNRRFDYDEFKDRYKETLDAPYTFITIHSSQVSEITLADEVISVENIDNVNELTNTDLTNTPIVMYIDSSDNIVNRKNLQSIICRGDIKHKQIFFCIKSSLNVPQIKRIIYDLGVHHPNIVSEINDSVIAEYFEVYPLTCFIKTFLDIFRKETDDIQSVLDVENEESRKKNYEIHCRITELEDQLRLLKIADDKFVQRDNFVVPQEYEDILAAFETKVSDWRKKKTKTTDTEEAMKMAEEYNRELVKYYSDFVTEIDRVSVQKSEAIDELFGGWFAETNVEAHYEPDIDSIYEAKTYITPELTNGFMEQKNERYVDQKKTLFGLLKDSKDDAEIKLVREITYSYEQWRDLAMNTYRPICQKIIVDRTITLSKYYSVLAQKYHTHITELINEKTELKNKTSEQLSGDEQLLQADNDWLTELKDRLRMIERG